MWFEDVFIRFRVMCVFAFSFYVSELISLVITCHLCAPLAPPTQKPALSLLEEVLLLDCTVCAGKWRHLYLVMYLFSVFCVTELCLVIWSQGDFSSFCCDEQPYWWAGCGLSWVKFTHCAIHADPIPQRHTSAGCTRYWGQDPWLWSGGLSSHMLLRGCPVRGGTFWNS